MTKSTSWARADDLLKWYDLYHRDLPWRTPPGDGEMIDPYHVWLSEIMLQQTTVVVVKGYFEKFLHAWPRVEDLAAAELDDVLRAWAGLGYYARARNLHKCAVEVATNHGGKFPETPEALANLPGIGPYTAAAISAIAFDVPAAAVDGNVERVMARLYAVETPLPDAKEELRVLAAALVPQSRAGDYAQAVMDLGATICAPRKANCLICPWEDGCKGRELGIAETLPRKKAKKPKPVRHGVCFWVESDDGAVLLRKRPEKGLLGGMMEVPSEGWSENKSEAVEVAAPLNADWHSLSGQISHTFTHFHLKLEIRTAGPVARATIGETGGLRWVPREQLAQEALPSVMRKVCAAVLGS
ncbi:MAG: A/G-specific adenine glycosylase [Hyphomicrobiales bacterium]